LATALDRFKDLRSRMLRSSYTLLLMLTGTIQL
jgi:hypothetical protein